MPSRRDRSAGRRGLTLVELAGAVLLLAVAMAATVRLVGWVAAERRAALRRHWAAQEVANAMEDLASRPYDRLVPGDVDDLDLSESAQQALPGAELIARVADADGPVPMRRIAVEIRWRDRLGAPAMAPVRLTAWVARRGEVGR